jgi:hypothetical protein
MAYGRYFFDLPVLFAPIAFSTIQYLLYRGGAPLPAAVSILPLLLLQASARRSFPPGCVLSSARFRGSNLSGKFCAKVLDPVTFAFEMTLYLLLSAGVVPPKTSS